MTREVEIEVVTEWETEWYRNWCWGALRGHEILKSLGGSWASGVTAQILRGMRTHRALGGSYPERSGQEENRPQGKERGLASGVEKLGQAAGSRGARQCSCRPWWGMQRFVLGQDWG